VSRGLSALTTMYRDIRQVSGEPLKPDRSSERSSSFGRHSMWWVTGRRCGLVVGAMQPWEVCDLVDRGRAVAHLARYQQQPFLVLCFAR
jgi:hypothetical protein